jgi:hypothetical protein
MTSAQNMLAYVFLGFTLLSSTMMGGCAMNKKRDKMDPPGVLVSPYDTTSGDVLWAIIPPLNESGTSVVDELAVGDAIVAAAQGVRGVRCLTLNRTIGAMRELGLSRGIQSSSDANKLAEMLGVDAVLACTITAYDPYNPPVLGLALALYSKPGALSSVSQSRLDSRSLTMAFSDFGSFDGLQFAGEPVSVVSEYLDSRNHAVMMATRNYAIGRSDQNSALGWRIYLASMSLYTQFAAHHSVGRLIDEEWLRLSRIERERRRPSR